MSAFGSRKDDSLMSEYASLLGDAVLRHRTRVAERTARIETELANKIKSEFISNMSHELRTPLNTVIGFSKLLADPHGNKLDDDNVAEYAALIHDAAVHLLSVINDILDISKMQSGKFSLNEQEVELTSLLHECVQAAQPYASSKGLRLEAKLPSNLPTVCGERDKLAQVFNSIISNAIKFTMPGGEIVVTATGKPDDSIAIVIRDTGVGMSEDELEIALTPFGQVDGSRSRWQEGAGLGLTIAKALTELHGGTLHIRSGKGRGTEVSVVLPSRASILIARGCTAVPDTYSSFPGLSFAALDK